MKYKKLDNNTWIVYIQENGKDKEINIKFLQIASTRWAIMKMMT